MIKPYTFPPECWAIVELPEICPECGQLIHHLVGGYQYADPILMRVEVEEWITKRSQLPTDDMSVHAKVSWTSPDDGCCQDMCLRKPSQLWPSRAEAETELTDSVTPEDLAVVLRVRGKK